MNSIVTHRSMINEFKHKADLWSFAENMINKKSEKTEKLTKFAATGYGFYVYALRCIGPHVECGTLLCLSCHCLSVGLLWQCGILQSYTHHVLMLSRFLLFGCNSIEQWLECLFNEPVIDWRLYHSPISWRWNWYCIDDHTPPHVIRTILSHELLAWFTFLHIFTKSLYGCITIVINTVWVVRETFRKFQSHTNQLFYEYVSLALALQSLHYKYLWMRVVRGSWFLC